MKLNIILAGGLVLAALAYSAQQPSTTLVPTPVKASVTTWEYKVVGMTDMHMSTIEYLKAAAKEEGSVFRKAKSVDEHLAQKTEDLLNELGADGWELLHHSNTVMVLKRPGR